MDIPSAILKNLNEHGLIPSGAKVVVGVSGGMDSIALLHALHRIGIPCTIAHMNHLLRGSESDADERFVRELATKLNLPLRVQSADIRQRALNSGNSIEMAARQARHAFFSEFKGSVIALAHHADDQVETFLLKLARGAGPDGLSGMAFSQQIESLTLIRPMLDLPRAAIRQWLESEGAAWREDSSNADEGFTRNKIRHSILPLLENELNPNLRDALLRTMNILREENEWIDGQLAGYTLQQQDAHPALRRRLLRSWLFEQGVHDVSFEAVEQILRLMANPQGSSSFELNAAQQVVVEYGVPRLADRTARPEPVCWTVTTCPSTGWRTDSGSIGQTPAAACFDRDKIDGSPIEVRPFRTGDRMNPLGMQGSRKLQDIFTDLKVPASQRQTIPVVVCRGEIIWIPGYRISRDWAVPDQTSPSTRVCIEQMKTDGL